MSSLMNPAEPPAYITAKEAANLLRISLRTLYSYIQHRRVPAPIWLGGKRLWAAQAMHDFVGSARNHRRR